MSNIKLQRAEWTTNDRHTLQNLGSSYELPSTCSITNINYTKNKNIIDFNYKTQIKNSGYEANKIEINGTIFIEASSALAIAKKNEIIQYINSECIMKIYQDKNDKFFLLGSVEDFNIEYERRRSILKINITFVLDEPFFISETKKNIYIESLTNTTYSIPNTSTTEFIPEIVIIANTTASKDIKISLRPNWATDDKYDTVIQKTADTITNAGVFYPKNFYNFENATDESLQKYIKIPPGDYKIIVTGAINTLGVLTLQYYERWI